MACMIQNRIPNLTYNKQSHVENYKDVLMFI